MKGNAAPTGNVELLDGAMLIGPAGDYGRLLRKHRRPWRDTPKPPQKPAP
jgi:hypothetical protein